MSHLPIGVLLLAVTLAITGCATASTIATPLPSDCSVTPAASSVPPSVSGFLGKWVGKWQGPGGLLDGTLVVRKVTATSDGAHKATAVYSWGALGRIQPGYREYDDAVIKDSQLALKSSQLLITYRLSGDGKTLSGAYDRSGSGGFYAAGSFALIGAECSSASPSASTEPAGPCVSPTSPKPYDTSEVQWDRVKCRWYCTKPEHGPKCPHSDLHYQ